MRTYSYIDASNIIYGTRDEGWKVDFKRLLDYLQERYECKKIYYFAGKDRKNQKQDAFYKKLEEFGYSLCLKEVKLYKQENGVVIRKANCDVDLTFYALIHIRRYDRVIFLSGDGDFRILLSHLLEKKKRVIVFANAKRTAKEIKKLHGIQFNDLRVLRQTIEYKK